MIAVNFCKKCRDCGECGEKNFFTEFHRISYNNSPQSSPHFLQKFTATFVANYCKKCGESGECGVKNNSPHFTAFLTKVHREIHRISYKNLPKNLDPGNKVIYSICVSSLVGAYYLHPPPMHVSFLCNDFLCNGTCSVTGGGGVHSVLGGSMEKSEYSLNEFYSI